MKDHLQTIVVLAAAVSLALGAIAYFAKASDLELVQMRLDQKIVSDQQFSVQQQIWVLEERNVKYGTDCSRWPDQRDREQYKRLKAQAEELQKKQDGLIRR